MTDKRISARFPYESKFVDVKGSKMHYVEQGTGSPVLFIHDIPTCNYLWRNIIPGLSPHAHCIAPDLIGMGKSDKPDIEYRVFDHIEYLEQFIETLGLRDITLVVHGWGSVIGFDYARRHAANVKAIAFIESYVRPVTDWDMLSLPVQEIFAFMHQPDGGFATIMHNNFLVDEALQRAVLRKLKKTELAHYRQPFVTPESRKPLWQYLQDVPMGNGPQDVVELIANYSNWLQKTPIPKLMLYAIPGLVTSIATVQWCKTHLPNLRTADLGQALHYPEETKPYKTRTELQKWFLEQVAV